MKKFFSVILFGILSIINIFAFTACGKNPNTTSDKILTDEELKVAIESTLNSKNGKIIWEDGAYNTIFYYDYEKEILKMESDDGEMISFFANIDGVGWVGSLYDLSDTQDKEWRVEEATCGTVKEGLAEVILVLWRFKAKNDTSSDYVAFEDTYKSFVYNTETNVYSATFLCSDIEYKEEVEVVVSLTVADGYVTNFVFELTNGDYFVVHSYEYSNLGLVELTVPDGFISAIKKWFR